MNRRDFLKAAIAAGVTLTLPGKAGMLLGPLDAAEKVDDCVVDNPFDVRTAANEDHVKFAGGLVSLRVGICQAMLHL